jgi:hypothetical protein
MDRNLKSRHCPTVSLINVSSAFRFMMIEELIEKHKKEIKQLNKFRAHIEVLKVNVGLSAETINELKLKINTRISQCEIAIRGCQKLK